MFLLNEFLKNFTWPTKKKRIGFVLDVLPIPYNLVMASTRIRAYDIIVSFAQDTEFSLELYRPWHTYDIVVFQKAWRPKHFILAQELQKKGTKVILDLNTLVFQLHDNVQDFIDSADHLLVSSPYLLEQARKLSPKQSISMIEELIPDQAFCAQKDVTQTPRRLLYVGYSEKANEVFRIQKVLQSLHQKHPFSLLFICEKNPHIYFDGIHSEFQKYHHASIYTQVLRGDIFIAPRDLSEPINLGHSFTKIGLPMAAGLPVVASPLPAYTDSPALLCATEDEWQEYLTLLFQNEEERLRRSEIGRKYCQEHYNTRKINNEYRALFQTLLS